MNELYKIDGVDPDGLHCEAIGAASEIMGVIISWFEQDIILLSAKLYHPKNFLHSVR
jgi:hypothetical protein